MCVCVDLRACMHACVCVNTSVHVSGHACVCACVCKVHYWINCMCVTRPLARCVVVQDDLYL